MAKKKTLGKPLPKIRESYVDPAPTAEEADGLAALWDLYAPKQYKGLLRAQNKNVLEQTGTKPTSRFVWNDTTRHYVEVKTGRVISRMELHRVLSQFTQAYGSR